MSVSKWAYESWKCDGDFCIGECDRCRKAEVEQDGFITWEINNEVVSDSSEILSTVHESAKNA